MTFSDRLSINSTSGPDDVAYINFDEKPFLILYCTEDVDGDPRKVTVEVLTEGLWSPNPEEAQPHAVSATRRPWIKRYVTIDNLKPYEADKLIVALQNLGYEPTLKEEEIW